MSRYIHTGIIVTAIGVAASAIAPAGAAGAYVVALGGATLAAFAGVYEWYARSGARAASAADRAARRIERITARAAARVDAVAARAVRAETLRAVVADAVGAAGAVGAVVDAGTGEVLDDDAPGVRFVMVDDDADTGADDTGAAPDAGGDFPCCANGEHERDDTTAAATTGAGA